MPLIFAFGSNVLAFDISLFIYAVDNSNVAIMTTFCPLCGNLLVAQLHLDNVKFSCKTCPITKRIKQPKSSRTYYKLKEIDDVLGGEEAWKNVDCTEERCPQCSHPRAYFMQLQIRSADEPMTTFYRCCNTECNHNWRD